MGARFTGTAVLQREGKRGGRYIVCNLICNVSMNIHAASITRSLYSSHTKLRLAQRGRSFLPSGGVSLPPTHPPSSPRDHYHMVRPHMVITLMISRGDGTTVQSSLGRLKQTARQRQALVVLGLPDMFSFSPSMTFALCMILAL